MNDETDSGTGGTAVPSDGSPLVGRPDGEAVRGGEPTPEDEKWPIGFMVILLLAALYLGWRLVQGVAWVVDKI